MKTKTVLLLPSLSFMFALTACGHNSPAPSANVGGPSPSPTTAATTAVGTSEFSAATRPVATGTSAFDRQAKADPYPKGMARTWQQCKEPGYNTNSGLCQPTGTIVPPSTPSAPVANQATIDQLSAEVSKLGDLDVTDVNPQGYPILAVECETNGQCINAGGMNLGSVADVAKEMPPVKAQDLITFDIKCNVICKDADGQIIGRVP